MIYEFRTYQIKAGSLQTVISKFQENIEGRYTISKIGASDSAAFSGLLSTNAFGIKPERNVERIMIERKRNKSQILFKELFPHELFANRWLIHPMLTRDVAMPSWVIIKARLRRL